MDQRDLKRLAAVMKRRTAPQQNLTATVLAVGAGTVDLDLYGTTITGVPATGLAVGAQVAVVRTGSDIRIVGGASSGGGDGYSPVVTVASTTTGAPGSSASVVDTDAGPDVALAFTIPAGADGQAGPQNLIIQPTTPTTNLTSYLWVDNSTDPATFWTPA